MSKEPLSLKVRRLIAEHIAYEVAAVQLHHHLTDDLGVDSLEEVELVMLMEEQFDIEVSDEEATALNTVQDVVDFLIGRGVENFEAPAAAPPAVAATAPQKLTPVSELSKRQLNWAVASVTNEELPPESDDQPDYCGRWEIGGPLIGKFNVASQPELDAKNQVTSWTCRVHLATPNMRGAGVGKHVDQLVAAMQALVHQHFGSHIALPAALRV